MIDERSIKNSKLDFISDMNSKKKLNIVEESTLEKVHILPIKKSVSNFDSLYDKLNSLINEKCILHEGFIISLNNTNVNKNKNENINKDENENESERKGENADDDASKVKDQNVNTGEEENNSSLKKSLLEIEDHKKLNNNEICLYDNENNRDNKISKDNHVNNDVDYVIIDCIPSKGVLSHDTLIYTDGKYVDNFKKIHILIINDKNYKKYEKKLKRNFFSFKKYFFKKSIEFFNDTISFIPFSFDCFSQKSKRKNESNKLTRDYKEKKKKKNVVLEKILISYLYPYFKKNKNKLFYCGKLFIISNFSFLIFKVDSDLNVGFIDEHTEIILNVDYYEQFNNVHIVPLYDTLPTTYNYDLFIDYIKPYIERHYLNLYSIYDTFFYKGVQFKIMGIDPINIKYGKARISCNTFIYIDGSIKPTFFDVISKEAINYIKCLPFEYKPYAILNILQQLDSDSLLRLFPSANMNLRENNMKEENILKQLTKHKYIFNKNFKNNYLNSLENYDKSEENNINEKKDVAILKNNLTEEQCAVCFEKFQDYDKCIKLICLHTYHWKCVKNWFKFNLTCPCCRCKLKF
ncbi:RING zinc finger protein, putative [Plasmodium gallinaceum]|uniref:RING-type E3 ubiquitin transferase n=1 Tax=Plasmodium gallinaceum TaxID=5849 RepID=A0A1J1GNU5_PLAGA|nr:RING zinc finger protein, putative [Plasmodium gallinaceum]CRG94130.1 RING zinc finger protein, putative [Plasmodium gallinaceum]